MQIFNTPYRMYLHMVLSEKKEDRNPGDRLPIGEAKAEIIKYILSQNEAVLTTEIKKYLKERYGIRNKKNIDNHLIDLKGDKCIEKIDPIKNGLENRWDITKKEHLKNIWGKILEDKKEENPFKKINLNKHEKSIQIVLEEFGYDTKSRDYNYRFIQLYMSPSFFNECLKTDIETLISRAWNIFQYNDGFKNENLIHELLTELNSEYIKGKLSFEMQEDHFQKVMEKLSQNRRKIHEDCYWFTAGVHTEDAKKKFRDSFKDFDQYFECDIENSLNIPGWYKEYPKPWIESFKKNLEEYVPELSATVSKTIQMTEDEVKNMYFKLEKLLSLIEKQRVDFYYTRFNVLFEYFFFKDIMSGASSGKELDEEIAFAQNAKKIISYLLESTEVNSEDTIIMRLNNYNNEVNKMIQDFKEKYNMPSN
jgi:hypothetical protein